jgi:hypothetical protein
MERTPAKLEEHGKMWLKIIRTRRSSNAAYGKKDFKPEHLLLKRRLACGYPSP